jgi:sarcosine oxidase subunit gamma
VADLRRSFVQQPTSGASDTAALMELALVDLCLVPRSGFKGRGTPEWLEAQGLILAESNQARRQADGTLAVRLGPREVLLLAPWSGAPGTLIDRLDRAWPEGRDPGSPRGYPVPRADSHCWFLLTGRLVPAMLAKLCGIDVRPDRFAPLQVAQTQAARLTVVIVRDDTALPAWHLLADSASAEYLWTCVIDAMAEFDGLPAGLAALGSAAASVARHV